MNHVNWWLFGVSFAMGLMLTLACLARPVKRSVPLDVPVDRPVIPDPATTRIVTDPATTDIPGVQRDSPTRKIAVPPPAQVWFHDEQSALRAGFTPWHNNSGT